MKKSTVIETKERTRKVSSGPLREKARSMQRLIEAVGKVIQKSGYAGLNVAAICKEAGLDRKLVYNYFGSLDDLIETYVRQKDYWNAKAKTAIENLVQNPQEINADNVSSLLQGQFEAMLKDKALQKIIHWEIGEKNEILKKLSNSREEMGEQLLRHVDPYFVSDGIDIRAILALQIGGLYYLSLHAESNGSTFCGLDINQPQGKERIKNALDSIIHKAFEKADFTINP
ncbi:TetR/AcrR family transcriptional regulator [Sphingobacterium alkalisoli]|uniref:TetR/AcrR family transcriptional regulator n=2 Tax=Sphingobacterium alkalisoli TaxID=1874115 RepID=A0A4U0H5U4_9SPHI|nr:TetR/AcrR family transcriptional regulator [Sphingobacterium alkalisoli]